MKPKLDLDTVAIKWLKTKWIVSFYSFYFMCIISMTRLHTEIPCWSLLQGIANPFCPPALRGISHLHWGFAGWLSLFPFSPLLFIRQFEGSAEQLLEKLLSSPAFFVWVICTNGYLSCDASSFLGWDMLSHMAAVPSLSLSDLYCVHHLCVRVIGCFPQNVSICWLWIHSFSCVPVDLQSHANVIAWDCISTHFRQPY